MFHHAVELLLWLLLAFALGAMLGCLLRAATGRGRKETEYELTGPMLADAYKAEGGGGTPVGRALGLMGSESGTTAGKAAGMASAAAALGTMGAGAAAAARGGTGATTVEKGDGAADRKDGKTAKDSDSDGAAEAADETEGGTPATDAGAAGRAASADAERQSATEMQGLMSGGADSAEADRAKEKPQEKPEAETAEPQDDKDEDEEARKWKVPAYGLDRPIAGEPDNLQMISGVGPKLEKLLHDLGIYYFAQIARWTKKDIAEIDDKLKFKGRIERDEWVRQAKLLAEGKMEQFEREYGTGGLKDASGKTRSGTRTRRKK